MEPNNSAELARALRELAETAEPARLDLVGRWRRARLERVIGRADPNRVLRSYYAERGNA